MPSMLAVQEFLRQKGSVADVLILPDSTATAEDAARAVGATVELIGKSVVFLGERQVVVVVVSGSRRVDVDALRAVAGDASLKKANANEVKEKTGFPIGGVSPFALPGGTRVIVDAQLADLPLCWVAAGHPKAVASISVEELVKISGAEVRSISQME